MEVRHEVRRSVFYWSLLGIWACAENASELAAPYGSLLDRGATAEEVLRGLFIHPSLAEGLLEAVRRL
jgi:pyruvate/2-oxoglutarate dehydrogenase complex dihydrolipoamide dehydrogenase (E3) component